MELELAVDHVAFGSNDLEHAIAVIARAGLSMTPIAQAQWPGEGGDQTARTVSVMTDDGYLDIVESGRADAVLQPNGVILRAHDIVEVREALMRSGVRCGRPHVIVRRFSGAGPDQRYTIFGIDRRHRCGLPQSVIATDPATAMTNVARHPSGARSLVEAARLLGVHLVP